MKVEIVAELAQGFEGSFEQARLLLKAAAAAGADAAKFQLVYAEELATPDYKHFDLFRKLEMKDEEWIELFRFAGSVGLQLYVDIFGARSLRLAERMGVQMVKLHGTDIANQGLLGQVSRSAVPRVLLGAGGAYRGEIKTAVDFLAGKDIVILLGFQGYPTPDDANQIARTCLLANRFCGARVSVGFADHAAPDGELCSALAAVAIGAGARVIEKHLTLGKVMKLEDHESALNPDEFAAFCKAIRGCAAAYGSAEDVEGFGMSDAELQYRKTIRRHVIATRDLPAGTVLGPADLALKRTSAGQFVSDLEQVYGRTLKCSVKANAPLSPACC